ncbi:hypothetical protein OG754_00315 [Streptomyces decoyicus]|uniref:hypothetical protein n=1 Tax=Streptomyces decoyicus TaxID=249567 RepID=UPI002E350B7E|nr:hypothetical protein [Streptomyces decoyicus]
MERLSDFSSGMVLRGVEAGHELSVCGAGGVEVVVAVGELLPQLGDVLFELADAFL